MTNPHFHSIAANTYSSGWNGGPYALQSVVATAQVDTHSSTKLCQLARNLVHQVTPIFPNPNIQEAWADAVWLSPCPMPTWNPNADLPPWPTFP
jgi:hypothetical protein